MSVDANSVFGTLPPERTESLLPQIRKLLEKADRTVFVLDDDPTGTQTVYDTPVLTTWTQQDLAEEWDRGHRLIYILTNSRALPEIQARELATEIGSNIRAVAESRDERFSVVSRSDSTLRGHYPAEVDALAEAIGKPNAPQIIMPYFLQGGRFTINDVHYVAEGDQLVPAGETPFANDAAFGFQNSNLIDWVIEKRGGQMSRNNVCSISLQHLRAGSLEGVEAQLTALPANSVCCVNAVTMTDVESFVLSVLRAEQSGNEFVFRTAASFVQSYAGLEQRPLLESDQMIDSAATSGLIVVGSYVPRTTSQLQHLIDHAQELKTVELDVEKVLGSASTEHLQALQLEIESALSSGWNVVLHTSRNLKTGENAESSLQIGNSVSEALVRVVRSIKSPLRFLIAKGGITSSDVATKALGVRRAMVLGQILPGIPVWRTQQESRRPHLPYIVFPGNVGGESSLLDAYNKLK